MQIVADLHTHTNVSHHAFSTLEEMIAGARRAVLYAIAITNHGPAMEDGAHPWHFSSYRTAPRRMDGVYLLSGIEMNILPGGRVDEIEYGRIRKLDFFIASFHEPCFPPATAAEHTAALEQILRNPMINCLGHLGNPNFPFDHERIISQCNAFGKIVEINNNSVNVRRGSEENCRDIARLCKQYRVPVAVNTDAHISYAVGQVEGAMAMLESMDFPEELVINSSLERLRDYFFQLRQIDILAE